MMEYLIEFFIKNINWQSSLLFIILSAGPTLLWLFICLKFDNSAPEPKKEILKTFFWGCLITFPIIPIAGYLTHFIKNISWLRGVALIFILSFLIDGLIEEFAKFFILRIKIYSSIHFDELRDGFIYGMTLGLGLAFVENILYGFIVGELTQGAGTIILRGFTSTFMHFLSGGIIGYYLGLVKFTTVRNPRLTVFKGFILAVLFHGFYNTIVRFGWWWNIIPLALLLIFVYLIILKRIKKFD